MVETEACPNHRLTVLGHINQFNRSVSHCYPEQPKPVGGKKEESVSAGAFSQQPGDAGAKTQQTKSIHYKAISTSLC